ncbi:MAG TPA: hypothetical protein DCM68_06940 [Verrucomicrobia bacterium]|nr:hypothetical protein [Verrucomicrobiota bacterium]
MMNLRKCLWIAVVSGVLAGTVWADPMRTVFTKENKFPGAMNAELWLGGSGSSYDPAGNEENVEIYSVGPGARLGLTDRVTVLASVPFVGYSAGEMDESGLGDIELGTEFLFFEDIFEYAWVIPHATAILPTGDEDKGLGTGEGQGRFGISVGTTVEDILHWAADVSYTLNGAVAENGGDDRDELLTGAVSLVWDLDERASVLGEVQLRDDPVDPDDDFAFRGHLGLAYRINDSFSLMGYGGGASGLAEDYYGMGRLVFSF